MLTLSAKPLARNAAVAGRVQSRRPARVVRPVMASSSTSINKAVQDALKAAEDECDKFGVKSKDCAVAWDQAEELLAAKADKKLTEAENSDPLEAYCQDAPDADECRVHEI